MITSVGLLSTSADVVILLTLGAAVTSPRVSPVARPVIATFAFACAWALTAMFDAMGAPRWTVFLGGAVIVVSIILIVATLHGWTQGADGGPGHRGNHGGGGPGRPQPDAPQRGAGDSDPSWWPEFERQLALHVAERDRDFAQYL